MDPRAFHCPEAGSLVPTIEGHLAFVPAPLPPKLEWTSKLVRSLDAASTELASLAGAAFPNIGPHILARPLFHQEAVMSSMIEGTISTLEDVFQYEALGLQAGTRAIAAREVHNYVRALEYGLAKQKELPVSLRLIRELHGLLLEGVRGQEYAPGEFRRVQNYIATKKATIATARYVPPPVQEMHQALDLLEKFIHGKDDLPPLVKAGLIHCQFEAIHPFMDGNGRVGRLLVLLLLISWRLIPQPTLYLSAYLEAHRQEYYDRLLAVSQEGDWHGWLLFFLEGVSVQSVDGFRRLTALSSLRSAYQEQLKGKRAAVRLLKVVDLLFERPLVSIRQVAERLGISFVSSGRYIDSLVQLGILTEVTGKRKDRLFSAEDIIRVTSQPPDWPEAP
jgi:Fic family protein